MLKVVGDEMLCQAVLVSTWSSDQKSFASDGSWEGGWGQAKEQKKLEVKLLPALWESEGERSRCGGPARA